MIRKKDMALLVLGILALTAVFVAQIFPQPLQTAAWGLSFQKEGLPPRGPAQQAELSRYDAAYLGDTGEKVLYLTFDAGYENGCTEKILDVLKAHKVPAAFFLVGNYIEKSASSSCSSFWKASGLLSLLIS